MNYKKTFIHLFLDFNLLPRELKEIIVCYCNFFPFDDYLEKGTTLNNAKKCEKTLFLNP
jgi:hypothetical protein